MLNQRRLPSPRPVCRYQVSGCHVRFLLGDNSSHDHAPLLYGLLFHVHFLLADSCQNIHLLGPLQYVDRTAQRHAVGEPYTYLSINIQSVDYELGTPFIVLINLTIPFIYPVCR